MFTRRVVGSLIVVMIGCGKKDETSSSKPPPPPPVPVLDAQMPVDAATTPPPIPDPPNYVVVKPAFGGSIPELPQLSRDGASAAVDLSEQPLVTSKMASFEVGFVSLTGKLERVAVLDKATAAKLAEDPATAVDTAGAQKSASTIAKRLADGGFSALATALDQRVLETFGGAARTKGEELPIPVDKAKLVASAVVHASGPTSLKVRLEDAAGKKLNELLVPGVHVLGLSHVKECTAAPRLGGVWYDLPRKRLLLQIAFMTAGECPDVHATYHLWKLP
jgi:hypothetical protein